MKRTTRRQRAAALILIGAAITVIAAATSARAAPMAIDDFSTRQSAPTQVILHAGTSSSTAASFDRP